eukprot:CCRYP_014752-RA/>CCRYP_014752-RA protein AED:0.54 eAED:0.34 QI:0/0/0/0.5/1/1/2/0/344
MATTIRRALNNLSTTRHVRHAHPQPHFDSKATTPLITFDSADSHYLSKQIALLQGSLYCGPPPTGWLANGSTSTATYASQLPFPQLSPNAVRAIHLPISHSPRTLLIGRPTHKVATASHSPNTKDGGNHGALQEGTTNTPTRQQHTPPIHRTSHQMDACSVWIPRQVHLAQGRPPGQFRMATAHLPQRRNTSQRQWKPKRAPQPMPQERRSTKPNRFPSKPSSLPNSSSRTTRVYTRHDTRNTIFSDQTGQFPHRSSSGNHYLMVMVDIDSSAILVEPIKNRTDIELTRAYSTLITRLHRAGVVPRKHVLDNEISTAMKTLITDTYKMTYELVPPAATAGMQQR